MKNKSKKIICETCGGSGVVMHPAWVEFYQYEDSVSNYPLPEKDVKEWFLKKGYDRLPKEEPICNNCDGSGGELLTAPLLEFSNPVFNDSLNLTVRRGIKWASIDGLIWVGEKAAKIKNTKVFRFSDITDKDLELEHDPSCRSLDGLTIEMQRVYKDFNVNEIVTLVFFEL